MPECLDYVQFLPMAAHIKSAAGALLQSLTSELVPTPPENMKKCSTVWTVCLQNHSWHWAASRCPG